MSYANTKEIKYPIYLSSLWVIYYMDFGAEYFSLEKMSMPI